jgi:hypothetical protein
MRPLARAAALWAALVVAAAVVAADGLSAARAAGMRREAIQSGDTVLADILAPGEVDEYVFDALRGGRVTVSFGAVAPGRWKAAMALHDAAYGLIPFAGLSPTAVVNATPLAAGGMHRLIVSSVEPSVGGYRIRVTASPGRSFVLSGTGDAAPAPLVFGALPDSEVTVSLRWRGPAPVTLASLTGPDGAALTSAASPKVRRGTSTQAGFVTVATGDHGAVVAVPTGTKDWSLRISVKPPRAPRGTTHDLRTVGVPEPPALRLVNSAENPLVLVEGETGGPNEILPYFGGASPGVRILDERRLGCGAIVLDPGAAPTSYEFVCANGWRVRIRDTVRADGRVKAFDAYELRSPSGTGRTTLRDAAYDALGRVAAWTETRTFDASGRTHLLVFSDILRRADGAVLAYSVIHTPPGGAPRRYDYGPSVAR